MMARAEGRPRRGERLWVLVILAIGTLLGFALSLVSIPAGKPPGPGPGFFAPPPEWVRDLHIILSTVALALLAALLLVYSRVYRDTKANFALGLLVVLVALITEAAVTFPYVLRSVGESLEGPGAFQFFGDIFRVVAFAVFLYLSLE